MRIATVTAAAAAAAAVSAAAGKTHTAIRLPAVKLTT
jgi:hypothetical protein